MEHRAWSLAPFIDRPRCNSEEQGLSIPASGTCPITARHLHYINHWLSTTTDDAYGSNSSMSINFFAFSAPFCLSSTPFQRPEPMPPPAGISEWRHSCSAIALAFCPCDRLAVGLVAPCAASRWDEPLRTGTSGDDGGYNSPKAQMFACSMALCN